MKLKLLDGTEMQLTIPKLNTNVRQSACTWFCCSRWSCSVSDCDNCPFKEENVPEEYAGIIKYSVYLDYAENYIVPDK